LVLLHLLSAALPHALVLTMDFR